MDGYSHGISGVHEALCALNRKENMLLDAQLA